MDVKTLAMPGLDDILSPVGGLFGPKKTAHFAVRSRKILNDRLTEKDIPEEKGPRDFTRRSLEAESKDAGISDGQMIGYVQANLVAGSDTTAIALRTALYYTLKKPWILERVRAEVDNKVTSFPIPSRSHITTCVSAGLSSARRCVSTSRLSPSWSA